jgi:CheY-like chemotaxis protein
MTQVQAPILVVEDDLATRRLLCEMLAVLGYRAAGVGSAEEALTLIEQKKEQYAVLLADIGLPGISGIELADIAVQKLPGLRVIFSSGNGFLVADKTDFDFRLMPKPYDLDRLQHALSDAPLYETD